MTIVKIPDPRGTYYQIRGPQGFLLTPAGWPRTFPTRSAARNFLKGKTR